MREETPRPDYIRKKWRTLNGVWQFEIADDNPQRLFHYLSEPLSDKINVPFAPQSAHSGINTKRLLRSIWYKRTFEITKSEAQGTVLLKFGAINYRAEVYINGNLACIHRGGYSPFAIDVSKRVFEGINSVVVNALDSDTDATVPCGGQATPRNRNGYTPTTGIWQSVWLEFSKGAYILDCRITPAPKQNAFIFEGNIYGSNVKYIDVTVSYAGTKLVNYKYKANPHYLISVPLKPPIKWWNILDGNLYDIELLLLDENKDVLDSVKTYSAFRTVEIADKKFILNGKETPIRAIADRGFFHKGNYTAPSAAAVKQEFMAIASLGFNAVLTRGKIPEPLYLYIADVLGIMILEEFPTEYTEVRGATAENLLLTEWDIIMQRDYGHPSIVVWIPNTKYFGNNPNFATGLYNFTKSRDVTRLVIDASGGVHYKTDIFTKTIDDAFGERFVQKLCTNYNGIFVEEGAQKKDAPVYSGALTANETVNLPFLITSFGKISIKRGDFASEKSFLSNYANSIAAISSKGAIGFVYEFLTDVGDDKGIISEERDIKLSREGQATFRSLNGLCFAKADEK